ncbi:MAG: hypothetical protein P1U56_10965 [Saprospiraceae bacterium]|nr:hypothetical protein [Saprospiraceae bacterium]
MTRKRTYNSKRKNWKKNLVWSVVVTIITGVLFMAVQRKMDATVTSVSISITGIKGGKNLVTKKGIKQMFRNYLGYDLKMSTVKDLNLMDMETLLEDDERIKEAEIYIDNKDVLHIEIEQRVPILRVFSKANTSYYLDIDGNEIPAYRGATIRVPVASGNIGDYDPKFLNKKKKSYLRDVYTLAKYIHEDEFLAALIEQIDVREDGEVMMVPKVGRQKLDFGHVENIEERFEKLKVLYRGGMEQVGWRKYDVLTLKYDSRSEKDGKKGYHLIYGEKRD